MKSISVIFSVAFLVSTGTAWGQVETAKVPTTDAQRIASVEQQLNELAARKPKLDCTTKYIRLPKSNHFMPSIPTPAGYQLVGGSCGFDEWAEGDNPTMIQVGPSVGGDGTVSGWRCYAKQSRAVQFTATATFCRIVME